MLCFRLHFTKESQAVINTAGATVRQLVALVFERVLHEDELNDQTNDNSSGTNKNTYDLQHQNGADTSTSTQDQKQPATNRIQQVPLLHHHQYNGSNSAGSDISNAVVSLSPCASDAYLMFQVCLYFSFTLPLYYNMLLVYFKDLVRLVNTDRPYWLVGMTEMTRTFGLELLESILAAFQPVFYKVCLYLCII